MLEIMKPEIAEMTESLRSKLGRSPRICILSLSNIPDDPRVRRQGDAFAEAGWDVVAVGLPKWKSTDPGWPVYTMDDVEKLEQSAADGVEGANALQLPAQSLPNIASEYAAHVPAAAQGVAAPTQASSPATLNANLSLPARLREIVVSQPFLNSRYTQIRSAYRGARTLFRATKQLLTKSPAHDLMSWSRRTIGRGKHVAFIIARDLRYALLAINPAPGPSLYLQVREIDRFYRIAVHFPADIYLANDWHMLPVAMKAASVNGTFFCYDTHEYALEEYKYRLRWRLTRRPMAWAVEQAGLRNALVASSVSQGIADDMRAHYKLSREIIEIRNVPNYRTVAISPPGDVVEVLYHGIVVTDRGLEDCIRSVPLWREEFHFILRGPGAPEYIEKLRSIARELGVEKRVHFAAPVAMTELVEAASRSQIGISTPPRTSKHNVFALPNKFFEYIQANLAICIADLPDMSRIVRQYDLGRTISDLSPQSIADAINGFDRDSIERYRSNSSIAAKQLNWETEKSKLVGSYSRELLAALERS